MADAQELMAKYCDGDSDSWSTTPAPNFASCEPSAPPAPEEASDDDLVHVERCAHCGVSGPQLHPPQHR